MWYSFLSTGVAEFDQQHANLDSIIMLYKNARDPEEEAQWLDMMYNLTLRHFQFEERFFGERFPVEHKASHMRIIASLTEKIEKRRSNAISRQEMYDFASQVLGVHFATSSLELKHLNIHQPLPAQ
jgi:hemerythrin